MIMTKRLTQQLEEATTEEERSNILAEERAKRRAELSRLCDDSNTELYGPIYDEIMEMQK